MNRFFEISKNGLSKNDFLDADPNIDLGDIDENFRIKSIATLEDAKEGDLSFFTINLVSGDKYHHALENTKASFCILKKQYAYANKNVKAFISDEPYITFIKLCDKLLTEKETNEISIIDESAKISSLSSIGNGVKIGRNVVIEDFVRINDGVEIGDNTVIKSGAKVGKNCLIGKNCILYENCVVLYAEIGDYCIIQSNATIGHDGFGYVFDRRTMKNEKIKHFGYVKIGNYVEIGSNSCIDRGVLKPTVIGDGVKLDNLVQIAHNVNIGDGTVIASQSGVAGSAVVGKYCMIGGKCGVAGHIKLGDQSILYGATNISKSFPKHSKVIGTPGEFYHIWTKNYLLMRHFAKKQRRKIGDKDSGFFKYLHNLFRFK